MSRKQKEIKDIRGPHPTPAPSQSVPDHPHPTSTLIEGGQEPGAGVGWGKTGNKTIKLRRYDMRRNTENKKTNGQENKKVGEKKWGSVTKKGLCERQGWMPLGDVVCRM